MGIDHSHALLGQLIKARSGDFGLIVVAAKVAVSEVIGQDQDDVRVRWALGTGREI
jgi:hypothetical protein